MDVVRALVEGTSGGLPAERAHLVDRDRRGAGAELLGSLEQGGIVEPGQRLLEGGGTADHRFVPIEIMDPGRPSQRAIDDLTALKPPNDATSAPYRGRANRTVPESDVRRRIATYVSGMSLLLDPPPARPTPSERQASGYAALSRMIRDAGLLRRRYGWYVGRCVLLGLALVLGFGLLVTLGGSPAQLLVAAGFGVLFTQFAYLAHDAAHRQIFVSGRRNEWFSLIIGNLFVGLSYGWWMRKHSRHHANPNKIGADGDIAPGALVFTAEDARERTGRRRPGSPGVRAGSSRRC